MGLYFCRSPAQTDSLYNVFSVEQLLVNLGSVHIKKCIYFIMRTEPKNYATEQYMMHMCIVTALVYMTVALYEL